MKNLKCIHYSLMAVIMTITILNSCEYDPVQKNPALEEQVDDAAMPYGHLSTKINLYDKNNSESGASIAISTNNEEIYAQLTADNFKADMVSLTDLEKSANENLEDLNGTNEDFDESLLNSEEHFLSIKILEEHTNEGEFMQYTFGDELLKVLKKYKAQTHISVQADDANSFKSENYNVNKNAFTAYGDGGVIPTKVRVYYDYDCGGSTYYKTTNSGFFNYYTFKSCKYPYERSARKRYKYFTVTQDVLKRYTAFKTSDCSTCSGNNDPKIEGEPKSIHTWLDSDQSDLYSYDIDIRIVDFPSYTKADWLYYFSLQVNFTGHDEWSHGGFQVANVVEFRDNNRKGVNWGGGSDWAGYGGIGRTNTPFTWKQDKWYRYRVWRLDKDDEGYWQWGFWVMDYETGVEKYFGKVITKSEYIKNATVWIETGYGVECNTEKAQIEWRNPVFNSFTTGKSAPNKGTATYNGTCIGEYNTNQGLISNSPRKWFQTTNSNRSINAYDRLW